MARKKAESMTDKPNELRKQTLENMRRGYQKEHQYFDEKIAKEQEEKRFREQMEERKRRLYEQNEMFAKQRLADEKRLEEEKLKQYVERMIAAVPVDPLEKARIEEMLQRQRELLKPSGEYVTKKYFDRILSMQNVTIAEIIKKVIELEEKIQK